MDPSPGRSQPALVGEELNILDRLPPLSEDGGRRGYFAPASALWRIARESLLMLGGSYALLMQAAHPLVAAGIVAHSSFRERPWRLAGTMSAIYTVVSGTRAEADRPAARVRAIHAGVQGIDPGAAGPLPGRNPLRRP